MALTILITNAGRAALINADKSGTRAVRVASVGVSPTATVPTAAATTLPGEIKKIATISGAQTAADTIHLTVQDESAAVYTVRSFGLYLDDGTLFAIYGQADVIVEKSAQALLLLAIDVTLQDIAATSITFGNANFLLPAATTERQGLVELATPEEGRAGTDMTRAVTPAVAKASVLAWLGYTPANRAGDSFTGRVTVRTPDQNLGLLVATPTPGYGFVQLGEAAEAFRAWHFGSQGDGSFALYQGAWGSGSLRLLVTSTQLAFNGGAVWHAGNDGAGSGLDADLLDGQDGSFYSNIVARLGYTPVQTGTGVGQSNNPVKIGWSGTRLKVTVDWTDLGALVFDGNITDVWRSSNDGSGSGLDADLLDGRQGSEFALLSGANFTGQTTVRTPYGNLGLRVAAIGDGYGFIQLGESANQNVNWHFGSNGDGSFSLYQGTWGTGTERLRVTSGGINFNGGPVWHAGNDGAGSGLDADLLDGRQGADFILKSGDTFGGQVAMRAPGFGLRISNPGTGYGFLQLGEAIGANVNLNWHLGSLGDGAFALFQGEWGTGTERLRVTSGGINFNGNPVWHAGNDGAGSGLDADLLDGQDGSFYSNVVARLGYTPVQMGTGVGQANNLVKIGWSGARLKVTVDATDLGALVFDGNITDVWRSSNDGSGSGLDADMVDGWQADDLRRWGNMLDRPGSFPPSAHGHSASDIAGAFANASLAANGYQVLPNGLILQWVTGPYQSPGVEAAVFVGWPIAFPNACFQAFPSTQIQSATDRGDSWFQLVGDPATDGCTVMRQRSGNPNDSAATAPKIFAIGR